MGKAVKKSRNGTKLESAERRQVAALPLRHRDGAREICLVTTRQTRRWTIPKGWPMKGLKDHLAAGVEAEQEAGLYGRVGKRPLGDYLYWKRQETTFDLVRVSVFRLDVEGAHESFREQAERDLCWVSLAEARRLVIEPGLIALLEAMDETTQEPA